MKTYSPLESLVEAYGLEWQAFRDSLEDLDKEAFVALMNRAKRLAEAGSKIESCPDMFESVVMSILVEHQRELAELEQQLDPAKTKTCPRCSQTHRIEEFCKNQNQEGILCSRCREAFPFMGDKKEDWEEDPGW
jgi:hypothetical protein